MADVGSGTGLLTQLFLRRGYRTLGVEPNEEMRRAGEEFLRGYPHFESVAGTAEATGLAGGTVDVVAAGQAFHWFDREAARREFTRILRPPGWVVLVWNERRVGTTPFLQAYERLLQEFATDYSKVDHRQMTDAVIGEFFACGAPGAPGAPGAFRSWSFPHRQVFDFEGVKGRLLSSSYAPAAGHPRHEPMLTALRRIFEAHQEEGRVVFEYDAKMYLGEVSRTE